jgi:hypothetical protein
MARAESIKFLLRIPPDAHETIKAAAKRADVSLNSFVVTAAIQVAILGPPVLGPPAMEAPSPSRRRFPPAEPLIVSTEYCSHPPAAR